MLRFSLGWFCSPRTHHVRSDQGEHLCHVNHQKLIFPLKSIVDVILDNVMNGESGDMGKRIGLMYVLS